jgi:predicted double-glycine peptidase
VARTFNSPLDSRLIAGVPFYPDDTNLCGPASLAALLTYSGYPTTVEEAAKGAQRWNLRGTISSELLIYARSRGAKASFFSSSPEELVDYIKRKIPLLVEVDNGIGPVIKAHFMVVVGFTPDGVVANNGLVQQEIIPWSEFLTSWYRLGYFAMVVDKLESESLPEENSAGQAPTKKEEIP